MHPRRWFCGIAAAALVASICVGSEFMPGKHTGVILFDRWDACIVCHGGGIYYVAEAAKESLRPSSGKFIQLNVDKIYQLSNPGDARLESFTILDSLNLQRNTLPVAKLSFSANADFKDGQHPAVVIRLENHSSDAVPIRLDRLMPMMLRKVNHHAIDDPYDGLSRIYIRGQSFWDDKPYLAVAATDYAWTVTRHDDMSSWQTELKSGKTFEIAMEFKLPEGAYDFFASYGGATGIETMATNMVAFDVDAKGNGHAVK